MLTLDESKELLNGIGEDDMEYLDSLIRLSDWLDGKEMLFMEWLTVN